MYRIDNATNAAALPGPEAVGPNPDGYFTEGDPVGGTPATIVTADWANAIQEEIAYVIEEAGDTLDKTDRTQLKAAIDTMIAASVSGTILGCKSVEVTSSGTGTTDMPAISSSVSITDGDEIATMTYNRQSASSKLYITASSYGGEETNTSSVRTMWGLFAGSACIDSKEFAASPSGEHGVSIEFGAVTLQAAIASAATGNITISLRGGLAGTGVASAFRWNGVASTDYVDCKTVITLLEVVE